MSVRIMSLIWDMLCESHTQKLVLLALADNANDQGRCWPSISTISRKCQLSERCVYEQLARLEKRRLLGIETGGGALSNCYTLKLPKTTPERGAGVNAAQGSTPEPGSSPPLNAAQGTPERGAGDPSGNHHLEPSHEPGAGVVNVACRKPGSVEQVIDKGKFIGVLEQDCRDWFRDCEACGWSRGDGTPFDNWAKQLIIHRDKLAERRNHHATGNQNARGSRSSGANRNSGTANEPARYKNVNLSKSGTVQKT